MSLTLADRFRTMWYRAMRAVAAKRRGTFLCGSRTPIGANVAGPYDVWLKHSNGDRVCSYCGSLHPDDFVEILRLVAEGKGGQVHRSDKSYKWYANRAGVHNAMQGGIKFYTWHSPGGDFADRVNEQLERIVEAA